MGDTIEKVSIIVSKGSLEGIYPALIMANRARPRASRRTCSSPSSASTPLQQEASRSHQGGHRREIRDCAWPPWPGGSRVLMVMTRAPRAQDGEAGTSIEIPEFIESDFEDAGAGLYELRSVVLRPLRADQGRSRRPGEEARPSPSGGVK